MAQPIVDGPESDLQCCARLLRLNLLDSVGMNAARRLGVQAVPTFIVLAGEGQVVDVQIGIPNRARLGAQVDSLMAK